MDNLELNQSCKACEGGVLPLSLEQNQGYLKELDGWELDSLKKSIVKTYKFKNYYEVIGFVNVISWISHRENHHPELTINYQTCKISYTTHAIDGLSLNDFICAKKVSNLICI
jgi:4a-hydroxytetrahydrobiopterin dehydratase